MTGSAWNTCPISYGLGLGSHGTKWLLWPSHHHHLRSFFFFFLNQVILSSLISPPLRSGECSVGPGAKEELGRGDRSPLCAHFLPLSPTGHRRALEEGIQPQPPDPAPGTPAGAPGLGRKGPAGAPGGAREAAGSAGSPVRYTASRPWEGLATRQGPHVESRGEMRPTGLEAHRPG